ncbi:MAG TPA: hypothetical protein VGD99_21800 [Anaerolineae bacterium]|jgi:hypothetical protein
MKLTKQSAFSMALATVVAVMLMALALLPIAGQPAQAAPPAAPTPVANLVSTDGGRFFRFQPETAITEDTNTTGVDLLGFDWVDIQHVIDQNAGHNITITVQYSNDNSNWVAGAALATNASTDTTDIDRLPVFGRFMRIAQEVADGSTDPVTVTVTAVGR